MIETDTYRKPRRILIRATNWIGDAVMTTPAVRAVREHFPDACITLLALPWVADIFSASPHVDEILLYERNTIHKGIVGKVRLARQLAGKKFDMAILLQNAFEAALLVWLARVPIRAGFAVQGRSLLLSHAVPLSARTRRRHQVFYYLDLLRGLGIRPAGNRLFLRVSDTAAQRAALLLPDGQDAEYIGINPGAAYGPAKRWPVEKLARLAAMLSDREKKRRVVVFGTKNDRQAAAVIQAAVPGVIDLAGRTTLMEAMACISRCAVFVTNDSGLMHVAAALNVPLVAIFGSTSAAATGPWSERVRIIEKEISCRPCFRPVCASDFRCMEEIGVAEVFRAVSELLGPMEEQGR